MNILCSICGDLITSSGDAFYVPCGHVFHYHCITQWLQRAQTCPECREKVKQHQIHRIYFNISNNDTYDGTCKPDDTALLKQRIDSLSFQMILKEKDLKHYVSKNQTLEQQTSSLIKEVKKLECDINHKDSAIFALKEQLKFFKQQSTEVDSLKREVVRLKKKLEDLQNIQMIVNNSAEDVDEMIASTKDPATLITYISVMKREMTTNVSRRRELRATVKRLQQEIKKMSVERDFLTEMHTRKKQLEEDLVVSESEKMTLQTKLKELERTLSSVTSSHGTSVESIESTNPVTETRPSNTSIISLKDDDHNSDSSVILTVAESPMITKNKENSPCSRLKSQRVAGFKTTCERNSYISGLSILSKRPRLTRCTNVNTTHTIPDEITYDGFGGHSKSDIFPDPIQSFKVKKQNDDVTKAKRQKLDNGNNKKLGDFIINLT